MAYLASIHRPSSVRHALKLRFFDDNEECLVVAKSNRLEFYTQSSDEDGLLQLRHSRLIHGKITMLNKLTPSSSTREHLFVGTHRYMYFTLAWDGKQLRTEKSYMDLADSTAREVQTEQRCSIDPSGEFLTLEVYEGIITTMPLVKRGKRKDIVERGVLGEPVAARIPEFIVRSSAFLPRPPEQGGKPKHALLYEDYESKVRLRIRDLVYTALGGGEGSVDFEDDQQMLALPPMDVGANMLIPVQGPPYGLLILAETQISYFDDEDFAIITRPLEEATSFNTWEKIDNQRYILGDMYGKLYLLMLILNFEEKVQEWRIDILGEIPVASCLVYLDAGLIFVGSHQGDSKVIRIVEGKDGGAIETVQTFSNVAPILDFTIMDMGNRSGEGKANEYSSGQARIVTGSGAFADGSLRSVRSGVGMQDLGIIGEMEHIIDVFNLKTDPESDFDDALLVSFIGESRIFYFSQDGEVEELASHKGLALDDQTLAATSLPNARLLQVTTKAAMVIDSDSGVVKSHWAPARGSITSVSLTDNHVLLSVDGTSLILLDIRTNLRVQAQRGFPASEQISCVALSIEMPDACIIGQWMGSLISVLSLSDLSLLAQVSVGGDSAPIPRNILITRLFEAPHPPTLLVATADGNVVTFDLDASNHHISGQKSTILGTQEASFRAIPRGSTGLFSVFTTCENPSLIYSSEDRIVFSAVTAENAVSVASFDTAIFPGAVAIATTEDLRIAIIDTERTTHVQTLAVGETVRRIAYSSVLRSFGLGTIELTLRDGTETLTSHFKLADEVLFKELDTYKLHANEIVETVIRAELNDGTGDLAERFVVGTSVVDEDETIENHGRIIVFEVTEDRILKQLAEQPVRGACRRLAAIGSGRLVAALNKTVVVFDFKYVTASTPVFEKRATYRTSTAPIDLTVEGNMIVVADLMKSVSVLEYREESRAAAMQDELVEVARHYQTVWSTAVSSVEQNAWLLADSEDNLLVLSRDTEGATEEDRKRLRVTSEMSLGEMVNKIRPVDVQSQGSAPVIPKAFLGTVEGSIYLFGLIAPQYQNLLMKLQENLSELVSSPGEIDFNSYRAFKNQVREEQEPLRFVDGDLVERFLEASTDIQEKVIEGLEVRLGEVHDLVEGLRRLH